MLDAILSNSLVSDHLLGEHVSAHLMEVGLNVVTDFKLHRIGGMASEDEHSALHTVQVLVIA